MGKKEKSENQKALPKFGGIVLLGGIIGLFAGGVIGFFGGLFAPDQMIETIYHVLEVIEPYTIWMVAVFFTFLEVRLYSQAKEIYQKWDGEEENSIEKAEEKLSWVLVLTAAHMVLSFFLVGVDSIVRTEHHAVYLVTLLGFIAGIGSIIILQQKVIDLTKKINPEKKGSVYDTKFITVWMESCDENEQKLIGQAAFKAYTIVSHSCVGIWLILFFISDLFHLGIMPITVVSIIWGILQISYGYESIKLGKRK